MNDTVIRVRRRMFVFGSAAALAFAALPPRRARAADDPYASAPERALTDAAWKKKLSPAAYQVLRHEGTEPPNSSPLDDEHRAGTFACAGCALPLFPSDWKFDSGTGWPSFYKVMDGAVATKSDRSLGMERTEYHCARCLGHQGHLFSDGPQPWGLRYCNNGVALKFTPA